MIIKISMNLSFRGTCGEKNSRNSFKIVEASNVVYICKTCLD